MKTALSLWYALQMCIESAAALWVIDAQVVRAWSTATVAPQRRFMVQGYHLHRWLLPQALLKVVDLVQQQS